MTKSCAKCEKTVYPLEELKCLDKIWHKGCFKCHECGMTLNMKTYKGFNKLPYCEAHVPKAKATTVAETPELKRIQENTKIQSNAAYHAEFEKSKGKFTQVADDPEMNRIKQNTKIISNVAYHGDLEKKALMEQKRNLGGEEEGGSKNGVLPKRSPSSYMDEISSVPTSQPPPPAPISHQQQQQYHQVHNMQQQPSYGQQAPASYRNSSSGYNEQPKHHHSSSQPNRHTVPQQQPQYHNQQQSYNSQDQIAAQYDQQIKQRSYQHQQQHQQQQQQQHHQYQPQPQYQPPPQHYGHQNSAVNSSPYSNRGQQHVIYTSDGGAVPGSPNKVGSIADYDPMNNYYPQQQGGGRMQATHAQQHHQSSRGQGMAGHHQQMPLHATRYRALYDYDAQDVDEVSFMESDLIIDCTPIEEGWLTGTVQRTAKRGMLPANYVAEVRK